MTTKLDSIQQAAEGATPGPWEADDGLMIYADDGRGTVVVAELDGENTADEANADFIALCNPATVLAMVKAIRAGAHVSMLLRTRQETQADEDASDAFDAALAKLEGVKP
jgi:hypothetical protein